jgi:hypothetical protein
VRIEILSEWEIIQAYWEKVNGRPNVLSGLSGAAMAWERVNGVWVRGGTRAMHYFACTFVRRTDASRLASNGSVSPKIFRATGNPFLI